MERSAESLSDMVRSDASVNLASTKGISRFSILCGFVMVDVYWLYLAFLSHVTNPLCVFVVDPHTGRHLQSGHIGSLAVTVVWSEMRLLVLLSMFVFALATLVAEATAKMRVDSAPHPLTNFESERR